MSVQDTIDTKVLYQIVTSLVANPEKVTIERVTDEMGVLLTVKVDVGDMGVLIGRNGIMADSIKTVLRAIGRSNDMNVRVKFLEPEGSVRTQTPTKSQETNDKVASEDIDTELNEFVIK